MKIKSFVRLSVIVVVVAAMTVLVAACGGSSDTPAAASPSASASDVTPTSTPTTSSGDDTSAGAKVTIANSAFSPSKIEVKAGTMVTWTNNDSVPHTVTSTKTDDVDSATSGLFDSGTLQSGETFSYTFKQAGDYPYECTIHASMASMHGKIEVK
jgi:plastocyanin